MLGTLDIPDAYLRYQNVYQLTLGDKQNIGSGKHKHKHKHKETQSAFASDLVPTAKT